MEIVDGFNIYKNDEVFSLLKSWPLCVGDIYWQKKYGDPIKILNIGDNHYDFDFSKYPDIFLKTNIDLEWVKKGMKLFSKLKKIENNFVRREIERAILREQIIKWVHELLWIDEFKKGNIFELNIVLYTSFINNKNFLNLFKIPQNIWKKSLTVASISSILAIVVGYHSYSFLKDFYSVMLLNEMGILDDENKTKKLKLWLTQINLNEFIYILKLSSSTNKYVFNDLENCIFYSKIMFKNVPDCFLEKGYINIFKKFYIDSLNTSSHSQKRLSIYLYSTFTEVYASAEKYLTIGGL